MKPMKQNSFPNQENGTLQAVYLINYFQCLILVRRTYVATTSSVDGSCHSARYFHQSDGGASVADASRHAQRHGQLSRAAHLR